MPVRLVGLGKGEGLPEGCRNLSLTAGLGPERMQRTGAEASKELSLRGRCKEPEQAVGGAVVRPGCWRRIWRQRKGGWTEGQGEGLRACAGREGIGGDPKKRRPREAAEADVQRGVGDGRAGLFPLRPASASWAQTPFSLARGEQGPAQAPPSLPHSTGGVSEAQDNTALQLSVLGCSPQALPVPAPSQPRRDPHHRKHSPGGAPPRAPAPACPLLPGIVLSTNDQDFMVQKPPEGKG